MGTFSHIKHAPHLSVVSSTLLDGQWGVETLLTETRQLLNIDDSVHQATIADVARDPEVRALKAGHLPPPSMQAPTLIAQLGGPPALAPRPGNGGVALSPQMGQIAKHRMPHGSARRQVEPPPVIPQMPVAAAPSPIQTGAAQGMYTGPPGVAQHQQRMRAAGHRAQPHMMAHPSMAHPNGSPPPGFRVSAAAHGASRASAPATGTPGGSPVARAAHVKRPSDDTASTTAGAASGMSGGGGGGGRGGKKSKPARQRALEQACPANLRDKINEVELQGLVIERHWEREGWCRGIIAHSVKRKGGGGCGYHIIYDLDSTTVRPSWELSVTLSTSQAGEKWRIPNPPIWVTRNWKDIVPPTSSKKTARKAPETQRATPAAASTAGHAAKPVSTLHPGVTFSASARASAAAAAAPEPPAPPPAAPSRSAGQKRPPPAAGGVRPPATAGVVPRAIPEEEIYVACREAEVTGNNSVVLQLLEGVRARRDWLCDSGARHRLGTLLTSVGPAGARKHLEKELLENRAKQRKLTAELYVPSK